MTTMETGSQTSRRIMGGMVTVGKAAPISGTRLGGEGAMISETAADGMRRQEEIAKRHERVTVRLSHNQVTGGALSASTTYAAHATGPYADTHMKLTIPHFTIGIKTIG